MLNIEDLLTMKKPKIAKQSQVVQDKRINFYVIVH